MSQSSGLHRSIEPAVGGEAGKIAKPPRRISYLAVYGGVLGGCLIAIVAFNYAIDPLHYYGRPFLHHTFIKNQRFQNAGLIRSYDYDAVIIGNSHTENFRPSQVDAELGWKSLKLSISGSTAHEQNLVLEAALRTGKVRHVLWGIDFESFNQPATLLTGGFPEYLYQPAWDTPLKYLLSWDSLLLASRAVAGHGPQDLETVDQWGTEYKFGAERVLGFWSYLHSSDTSHAVEHRQNVVAADSQTLADSIDSNLARLVRKHPEVEFVLFFPPRAVLSILHDFTVSETQFDRRLDFQRAVVEAVGRSPNCRLHHFQQATDVTHNLDNYRDLTHYRGEVSDAIVSGIAAGSHRVTRENIDSALEQIRTEGLSFVQGARIPGSEWYSRLQLGSVSLFLPAQLERTDTVQPIANSPDRTRRF